MRLKNRLSIAVTTVTSAALAASFVIVYVLVRRDETRDLERELAVQALAEAEHAIAQNPQHPEVTDGSVEVPESLDRTPRYVAVYGTHGEIVSSTRSFHGAAPPFESLGVPQTLPAGGAAVDLAVRNVRLRGVVVPLDVKGDRLLYATSRRTIDEDTQFMVRILSGLLVVTTLVTAFFARWLGARLARDVLAIATVARAVAEGDIGARVGRHIHGSAETRALASDLDHMVAQLGALVEAQRTFISYAAHELRSPLATLRGELQLALRRPREPAEYRVTLGAVLADVDTLTRLAEDLLTLARVQASAPDTSATARLEELLADAVHMAQGPADARGVTLRTVASPEGGALTVRGKRSELSRALRNLVDNAVTHSPAGSTVTIELTRSDDRAHIAVSDEGPGVPTADLDQIFAPFYRGSKDQAESENGAGLGLSIARGIAHAYGGDITVDAGLARGARFVLVLPAAPG